MRKREALEDAALSEFQQELVQLGAVLKGDSHKDIYPERLVEGMTVAKAAAYVQDAFKTFLAEADRCRRSGADGSHVVVANPVEDDSAAAAAVVKKKSFLTKVLGCFACGAQSPTSE